MSLIQGRDIKSIADQFSQLPEVRAIYEDADIASERQKEQLDELLNFIKLKHYLLSNGYASFHLKIAPNTYYTWELGGLNRAKTGILSRT